jgi:cytoskeletal protein CcmA (bactofilin family)
MKFRKNRNTGETVTVIARGMLVDAKLVSGKGTLRIEGGYHGDIDIDGDLILEQSGHITGQVKAVTADISGSITGNIACSEWLHIKSAGKIKGDITCDAILMDEGAVFIGYSNMKEPLPETGGINADAESVLPMSMNSLPGDYYSSQ